MIGGTARITSASSTTVRPSPRNASPIASTTMLGSARPTLPRLIARKLPRWRWPSHKPMGSAITSEIPTPIAPTLSVSSVRWTRLGRFGAPGTDPSRPMNLNASTNSCTDRSLSALAARAQPGRERALGEDEQAVARDREADREGGRAYELGLERTLAERDVDGNAEACVVDRVHDRRERDRGDDRDAEPGDDRGKRERELHAHERLRARHAHPFGRVEHLLGDFAKTREGVAEEDQQGVRHERDLGRVEVRADGRDEQLEQRERRDRV